MSSDKPNLSTEKCMDDLMINEPSYEQVNFCRLTSAGENLLHDFGVETAQLNPEHYFIPWVTFDNVRLFHYKNFKECSFVKTFFFIMQVWNKDEFEAALADLELFLCDGKFSHVSECQ